MANNKRARENRAIRQEALREWLSEKCTTQHVIETIEKIESIDGSDENDSTRLQALKIANDQRIKLIGKYLPDLKAIEHTYDQESDDVRDLSTDQLKERLAQIRDELARGGVSESGSERESSQVH